MYGQVMHMCSGRLYTHTTIGHTEYGLLAIEYSENPSVHTPGHILCGSTAKDE